MSPEEKAKIFTREFMLIKHPGFNAFCKRMMGYVPEEFFDKPASSTGKYHPRLSVGPNGLVWHTKYAFWIGVSLLKPGAPFSFMNPTERDCALASILFHDTMKYGFDGGARNRGYTYFEHPLLVEHLINKATDGVEIDPAVKAMIDMMLHCTVSHMGTWNTNNFSKIVLPRPESKIQKFVHFCDYISSVKINHFDYEELDGFISTLQGV